MIYLLVGSWEKRWNWVSQIVKQNLVWKSFHQVIDYNVMLYVLFLLGSPICFVLVVSDGIFTNFIYMGFAFRYMSSSLLKVAQENSSVVAVVGKGHLQGIQKYWKQPVEVSDIFPWNTMKALPSYLPCGWKLSFWYLLASFWY